MAHVPAVLLKTRSMTESGPKTEWKLAWLSRKLSEPRYVVNPSEAIDYRTQSILGVEEEVGKEGNEVKVGERFTLGVVTPDMVLVGARASIIN